MFTSPPSTDDCLYLVSPSQGCPQRSACAGTGARRRRTPPGPPDPSCKSSSSYISADKSSRPALQSHPLERAHLATISPERQPPPPSLSLHVSMDTAGNEGALTPRRHWLLPAGCSEVIAFTRLLRANQSEGAGSGGTDLRGGTPFTPPSLFPPPPPAGLLL